MRIFTVNRESGSSLKSKTKTVCTRSRRSRIAYAAYMIAFTALAASSLSAPSLSAQTGGSVSGKWRRLPASGDR